MPLLGCPGVVYADTVHLHVDQALRTVCKDQARAEQLRFVMLPLKAWMSGECFETPQDAASSVYFSVVKRFARTLHTVCSPILFCPAARAEALRVRRAEEVAEAEGYRKLAKQQQEIGRLHGHQQQKARDSKEGSFAKSCREWYEPRLVDLLLLLRPL